MVAHGNGHISSLMVWACGLQYTRHVHFINTYVLNYVDAGAAEALQKQYAGYKTDSDIRREQHRFLWEARDEVGLTWEKRLAKRYYDKLYKEYAIADLSRYKDNKIALRWRTQQEVIDGKGMYTATHDIAGR